MKKRKTTTIGLTGSIATGKSTAAKMFAVLGADVFSADDEVHNLLTGNKQVIKEVGALFPAVIENHTILRSKLSALIFKDAEARKQTEALLHPRVLLAAKKFIAEKKKQKKKLIVLEVPLLFETAFHKICDISICVTVSARTQKERAMKREGMTTQRLRAILKRQWSDQTKCAMSDFVITTDKGMADTRQQIKRLYVSLIKEEG